MTTPERALRRLVAALEALDRCGRQRGSGCMELTDIGGDDLHGRDVHDALAGAKRVLKQLDAAKPS